MSGARLLAWPLVVLVILGVLLLLAARSEGYGTSELIVGGLVSVLVPTVLFLVLRERHRNRRR